MPKSLWLALAALAVLVTVPAVAAPVDTVYEAEVPVATRGDVDRARAVRDAMARVLVKVTGDRNAPRRPEVAALLDDAGRYVQQYQYLAGPARDDGERAGLVLRVRFDRRALEEALAPTELPLWGRERPATVLWLAVDDGERRGLIGADDAAGYAAAARARAAQRGIPITLPLLDLQDAAVLGHGGQGADLAAASARYGADAVLSGAVARVGPGIWEGRWTLELGGSRATWSTQATLAEAAIEEGIDVLADALAARFARPFAGGADEAIELVIYGVEDFAGYARALAYLSSLDAVGEVQVRGVSGDRLAIGLRARGGMEALSRIVALGQTLEPIGPGGALGAFRLRAH